ncbi:MAG TPA: DUF975 family protein [Candidatus Merdenecus merdavium]|nr:DUF975 family protein [Candidatus Merdenecus merdavium]
MNYSCAQLKQMAKQRMRGNFPHAILIMLIIGVASSILYALMSAILGFGSFSYLSGGYSSYNPSFESAVLSLISFTLITLFLSILETGDSRFYYNVTTGRPSSVEDILFPFRNHPLKALGIQCLIALIGVACLIPLYFVLFLSAIYPNPGIILLSFLVFIGSMTAELFLMLSFSQAVFVYVQNPEIGVIEALRESYKMMRGYRVSLLYMNLSFIPMLLLVSITCGIASLYVTPYMSSTQAMFYLQVSGQLPPEGPFSDNGWFYQQNPYNQGGQYGNQGPYNQNGPYSDQGPYNQNGPYPDQDPYNQNEPYPNQNPYDQDGQYPNSNDREQDGQNYNDPYDIPNQESDKKNKNGQSLDGYENPYKDNYYN